MAHSKSLYGIIVIALLYLHCVSVTSLPHQGNQGATLFTCNTQAVGLVPQLEKRDDYDDCYNKGWGLQCRLTRWAGQSTQNTWNDYTALQQNGWAAGDRTDEKTFPHDFDPMFQGLGLASEGDKWVYVELDQIFDFPVPGGDEGEATDALYHSWYNPSQGAIIAADMRSPKGMIELGGVPLNGPFPALQRWSDLTWLEWEKLCAQQQQKPSDLDFIIHREIYTPKTKTVIDQILKRQNAQLSEWPGLEVSMLTPAGTALMGTPHGIGVAWLLIDRRSVLSKTVASVIIFKTKESEHYQLAYKLGPI